MKEKSKSLFIKCDCHCCGLSLESWDFDNDCMYMSFWIDEFYAYQSEGFWRNLWERIKLAFKVLRKGDYFLREVAIEKNDVQKLKEYFNQF